MARTSAKSIDSYIGGFSPEVQEKLQAMRTAIREAAPEAQERISWAMPTFWQKRNIAHFAAHARHIGFYPGSEAIEAFAERLKPYKTSKGAVQIPMDAALPLDLIRDMVRYNIERLGAG
jgi:uncharacterized protein YdhG (YjbR/CyaY superfamily)